MNKIRLQVNIYYAAVIRFLPYPLDLHKQATQTAKMFKSFLTQLSCMSHYGAMYIRTKQSHYSFYHWFFNGNPCSIIPRLHAQSYKHCYTKQQDNFPVRYCVFVDIEHKCSNRWPEKTFTLCEHQKWSRSCIKCLQVKNQYTRIPVL